MDTSTPVAINSPEPVFLVLTNPFQASLHVGASKSAALDPALIKVAASDSTEKVTKDKTTTEAKDRSVLVKLYVSCTPEIVSLQQDLQAIADQVSDPAIKTAVQEYVEEFAKIGESLLEFAKKVLRPEAAGPAAEAMAAASAAPTAPPVTSDTTAGVLSAAPTATPAPPPPQPAGLRGNGIK